MSIDTLEAIVKRSKNARWNVSVDGERIGQVDSLGEATSLLWEAGFKTHTYRRGVTTTGKPLFRARVIRKKDD